MDNIKEWTSLPIPELFTMASRKEREKERKRISVESSLVSPDYPIAEVAPLEVYYAFHQFQTWR